MSKSNHSNPQDEPKVRLDKWLWAARFYKTRSIAKDMIDGGKVHYDGHRVKPSKEVAIGANIQLRQGNDEKTVEVIGLSEHRGNATKAATLYTETEESVIKREAEAIRRKQAEGSTPRTDHKPNKKERRKIIQFNQINQ